MGIPTSEVNYTPAMPRREDHEVHKDMWWHWEGNIYIYICIYPHIHTYGHMQHYKIVTNIICTALAIIMVVTSGLGNAFTVSRME